MYYQSKTVGWKPRRNSLLGNKNFQQWESNCTSSQRSTSQRWCGQPYPGWRATSTEAKPCIYGPYKETASSHIRKSGKRQDESVNRMKDIHMVLYWLSWQEEARYIRAIMDWPITSKPWSICRSLSKSQFPFPSTIKFLSTDRHRLLHSWCNARCTYEGSQSIYCKVLGDKSRLLPKVTSRYKPSYCV